MTEREILAFSFAWSPAGPGCVWIRVRTTIGAATVGQLERLIMHAQIRAAVVVLDLRGLPHVCVDGAEAIAAADQRGRCVGRKLLVLSAEATTGDQQP